MKWPCSASIAKGGIQNNITVREETLSDDKCDGVLENCIP